MTDNAYDQLTARLRAIHCVKAQVAARYFRALAEICECCRFDFTRRLRLYSHTSTHAEASLELCSAFHTLRGSV